MLFVIRCIDREGSLQVRLDNRADHLEYLHGYGDRLKAAGPTLDEEGNMNGSVVILDLEDRSEAEAFAAGDPYRKAGLFERVEICTWKKVLPESSGVL